MKATICQAAFLGLSVLVRSGCCADCAVPMASAEEPSVSAMTAVPDLIDESGMEVREGRRTKIIYKLEPKGEALLVTLQKRYTVWVQAIDMIMKGA